MLGKFYFERTGKRLVVMAGTNDETTKNLFARFAEDRRNASSGEQAAEDELFFAPMFKGDTFQNTAESRHANRPAERDRKRRRGHRRKHFAAKSATAT